MKDFLIIKLHGPMQAWGEHTFEGLRPSANFPTRSGILGLLGACLGIRRNEPERLQQLADSVGIAVRVDERDFRVVKITDYHTVRDARADYIGKGKHETILTWREYLLDAHFSIAVWNHPGAAITLDALEAAVKRPCFTPYLGRRSCPLTRPLFESRLKAVDSQEALKNIAPHRGTIYSEEGDETVRRFRMRDVPLVRQPRQFAARNLYVYGGDHVPE
ncbi:MAG: type I-E CRISPR-associated protein Cas5/CasD [Nitrospiraceae bacterium]|nr:MAG: type I-E CRISPR-associated protein Cas5/CasD [Nitrospiraceae bacterium]